MNRNYLILVFAVCQVIPIGLASAAVFERDWKTPGDGLLTYDDVNQREWLELTESVLSQFGGSGTPQAAEAYFQAAKSETAQGGRFETFAVATIDDVTAFAQSAGIDVSTLDFATNQAPASNLIDLVGTTHITPDGLISWGVLNQSGRTDRFTAKLLLSNNEAGLQIGQTGPSHTMGVWLYRQVPEPNSLALGTAALFGLLIRAGR